MCCATCSIVYDQNKLQLDQEVIYLLKNLPAIHRDPFDRILVAHAIAHGPTILTPDSNIHRYPVHCLW